jgi:hypothetical protein
VAVVVIPPFANTRCGVPSNKDEDVLRELLLVKLQREDKAETVPLELLRASFPAGKSTDRVTHSPRPREGRREVSEGTDVFARDLRGCLPIVECKSQRNSLLESHVANEKKSVDGSRPALWKG